MQVRKPKRRKSDVIFVRVTPEQRRRIATEAKAHKCSAPEFMRALAAQHFGENVEDW